MQQGTKSLIVTSPVQERLSLFLKQTVSRLSRICLLISVCYLQLIIFRRVVKCSGLNVTFSAFGVPCGCLMSCCTTSLRHCSFCAFKTYIDHSACNVLLNSNIFWIRSSKSAVGSCLLFNLVYKMGCFCLIVSTIENSTFKLLMAYLWNGSRLKRTRLLIGNVLIQKSSNFVSMMKKWWDTLMILRNLHDHPTCEVLIEDFLKWLCPAFRILNHLFGDQLSQMHPAFWLCIKPTSRSRCFEYKPPRIWFWRFGRSTLTFLRLTDQKSSHHQIPSTSSFWHKVFHRRSVVLYLLGDWSTIVAPISNYIFQLSKRLNAYEIKHTSGVCTSSTTLPLESSHSSSSSALNCGMVL